MPPHNIRIEFMDTMQREQRFVAHTCSNTLELSFFVHSKNLDGTFNP